MSRSVEQWFPSVCTGPDRLWTHGGENPALRKDSGPVFKIAPRRFEKEVSKEIMREQVQSYL